MSGQLRQVAAAVDLPPPYPSFDEAFAVFAKIGLLSFGGPAGQIALMHKVLVEEKRWISEARFLHALNYCMLLPGPEAQQLATYIGWLLHGVRGGITAGTLFVLPGFCVIVGLSVLYTLFSGTALLDGLFFGLKAAVLAVVIEAVIRVGRRALKNRVMIGLAAAAFLGIFVLHLPFPFIVLAAGLFGYLGTRIRPTIFAATGHGSGALPERVTLDLKEPETARGFLPALRIIAVWGVLWALPVVLAVMAFGQNSVFPAIAGFFSKMAVVTFGGAYAVLAYVAQEAVASYGWLKPGEMLDGLALAETTPGPLILVLTYVGFLASYRAPGALDPLAAGLIGAALTTWVTFVPCFLWIFLGAPYVERLRGNKALSGALAAITAAVVGVILNLALWFGLNFLFASVGSVHYGLVDMPWPHISSFKAQAGLLAILAAIGVFRLRLGMIRVLALSGVAGLMLGYVP